MIDPARLDAGRAILDLTDAHGFDAFAAGWIHDRATGAWRYVLVTPMLRSRGPRWVYERLMRLFRHRPLPEGISPLDIVVLDPGMEEAAFGPPLVALDERALPPGVGIQLVADIAVGGFLVGEGFVAFYRRLPLSHRGRRRDPATRFDAEVRRLAA